MGSTRVLYLFAWFGPGREGVGVAQKTLEGCLKLGDTDALYMVQVVAYLSRLDDSNYVPDVMIQECFK